MVFNSVSFLFFFLAFFFVYWLLNNRTNISIRNTFIILASYLFYGWWDWRFLSLIILSSTVDFILGILLFKQNDPRKRKFLLLLSVITNLGILAFFKYFNFFIDSFKEVFQFIGIENNLFTLNIILPVGISFYTFQTLSYTIDIYRRQLEPTKDIFAFFAFVSFFPQLVAGPIERASHFLKQFQTVHTFSYQNCISGLRLILWGFFKKLVIADNFGVLSDRIFNPDLSISGITVFVGALFFAIQIYADFSGYSDIAIGLARTLGFNLRTNFSTPYFAKSFTEFWRRWHISLSSWFRDYVYIPLGGSKRKPTRVNLNVLLTFLLSGLWHGANITFLIWGSLHGVLLVLERRYKRHFGHHVYSLLCFTSIVLLWLPFRAESYSHLSDLFHSLWQFNLYSIDFISQVITTFSSIRFSVLLLITVLFFFIEYNMQLLDFDRWIGQKKKSFRISTYYALIIVILLLGNFSVKPNFIYFQF